MCPSRSVAAERGDAGGISHTIQLMSQEHSGMELLIKQGNTRDTKKYKEIREGGKREKQVETEADEFTW